jgi:hypothetical protein
MIEEKFHWLAGAHNECCKYTEKKTVFSGSQHRNGVGLAGGENSTDKL